MANQIPVKAIYSGSDVTSLGEFGSGDKIANSYLVETVTSLSLTSNNLKFTDEAGAVTTISLSPYIDDTNLARLTNGTLNASTGMATFTRDDSSTFTVDLSSLLDTTVTVNNTLTSTSTSEALSANQGKVLKGLVDGKVEKTSATGSAKLPAGTSTQRDSGLGTAHKGYMRFNTTDDSAEIWDGSNWSAVGGGNSTDQALYEHSHTISSNYSITTGNNAITAGPVTINTGVTVTVPSGSTWVVA